MNEQLAYTLAAASVGFVAAAFFGFGAALMRQKTIVLLASTFWDYNKEQATAVVSQSAQYLVGGLLLVVSFGLQIAAALASPASQLAPYPVLASPCIFVLVVLLLTALLSWLLYGQLLRWRLPPILRELEERTAQEEAAVKARS